MAEEVKAGFDLETIYFIPSSVPPHKGLRELADAKDRFQMIDMAISPYSGFELSDVEIERRGPSYSIDTVNYFKSTISGATPCYLIVGMDAFLEFDTWRSFQTFFDLISFIVMTRPADADGQSRSPSVRMEQYIYAHIDRQYKFVPRSSCFEHPRKKPVYLYHVTPVDVSSTRIRELVRQGASIKNLVPAAVENYIHDKGLYV